MGRRPRPAAGDSASGATERRSDLIGFWGETSAWCATWGDQAERCQHDKQ